MNDKLSRDTFQYSTLRLASVVSAVICVVFALVAAITPNLGFQYEATKEGWLITEPCTDCVLRVGDQLLALDDIRLTDNSRDDAISYLLQSGRTIQIERVGEDGPEIVSWTIPNRTGMQFFSRILTVLFILPFWFCGALIAYYIHDGTRRVHFSLLMFGYAIWFAAGLVGPSLMRTTLILRGLSWVLTVAAIHFHWKYPSPSLRPFNWTLVYIVGVGLGVADVLGFLGNQAYMIPILVQVVVSLSLLTFKVIRYKTFPSKVMVAGFLVSFSPGLADIIIRFLFNSSPGSALLALFIVSFTAWPFFYTYALFHSQLQKLESNLRKALTAVATIIIYLDVLIMAITIVADVGGFPASLSLTVAFVVSIFALPIALGLNWLVNWSNEVLYGRLNRRIKDISTEFGTSLVTALDINSFLSSTKERLSQLGVSTWAIYERFKTGDTLLVSSDDAGDDTGWSVLVVPLVARGNVVGELHLGEKVRGNNTFYDLEERAHLESLGAQIAAGIMVNRLHTQLQQEMVVKDALHERLMVQGKMAVLGQMAGRLAHDIMTPLQTVTTDLEMALMYVDDANQARIKRALTQVERIAQIVRDVRSLARPASDFVEEVNVLGTIKQAITFSEAIINCQITLDVPDSLTATISQSKLIQVLTNLITNACDAMSETTEPLLVISAEPTANGSVAIIFSDNGVGIPAENILKLFDPFFTTKRHGSGLGLSICYSIIEEARGDIFANSEPGHGSTFTVVLPTQGVCNVTDH